MCCPPGDNGPRHWKGKDENHLSSLVAFPRTPESLGVSYDGNRRVIPQRVSREESIEVCKIKAKGSQSQASLKSRLKAEGTAEEEEKRPSRRWPVSPNYCPVGVAGQRSVKSCPDHGAALSGGQEETV
ncbi:hypothetical protein ZHAS_00006812 [Anopheles sinensis]|uniref:Uncharacterized protein n=1 Tax=Anopheles sinensis TaxID=74873 RepID=A0A084VN42_ANOSI|nr:hypothetical protein ZHAS_00006812 [Anopheles sinensis]